MGHYDECRDGYCGHCGQAEGICNCKEEYKLREKQNKHRKFIIGLKCKKCNHITEFILKWGKSLPLSTECEKCGRIINEFWHKEYEKEIKL